MILIDQKDFEILKEIFAKLAVVLQHCDYSVAEEALLAKQIKGLHALGQTTPKGVNEEETSDSNNDNERHFIKFTKEEIFKMPKNFKKIFREGGYTAHVRRRKSGANTWNYEIRFRRDGYNICVSANNLESAKRKFIEKARDIEKNGVNFLSDIPTAFDKFAMYFFENFYKRKVVAETYRIALNQFKNHIAPKFGSIQLKAITPKSCQELIDKLVSEGKERTSEDIHSLLNMIFKAAIKHNLITSNPIDMVIGENHERTHGKALTEEEEKKLLAETAGTPFHLMFVVPLYTGMRPCEYATARIEGKFIIAENRKQKKGKVVYKKIPITPMLRPYLEGVTELKFFSLRMLRGRFAKILPNHKLYDLRTTFYTHCQECKIALVAIKKFVGHKLGGLADTYTDISDEFLLKEGEKFRY